MLSLFWVTVFVSTLLLQECSPWNLLPRVRFRSRTSKGKLRRRRIAFATFPKEDKKEADSYFMRLALEEAQKASTRNEVPIGALIVRSRETNHKETFYEVLSANSNRVEELQDASAHAELLALRGAAQTNRGWRLLNCTLYSTLEPCAMCLSAAQAFRIDRIVYGAPDLRVGAIDTYLNLLETPHPIHSIQEVVRGIHQNESSGLMRDFFRQRRQTKKQEKSRPTKPTRVQVLTRWKRKLFSLFRKDTSS